MLAPWDVAAGTLIVREAGGVVTDANGADASLRHGSFVAGNPTIHEWLLGVLDDADGGGGRSAADEARIRPGPTPVPR